MADPLDTIEVDETTQTILLHASRHDVAALKPLLRIPGNASVQDPETGYTPLHAAIAACGDVNDKVEDGEEVDIKKAEDTVRELLLSGAIWNDLDNNDETPGCLASRSGRKELYELIVEAGVRAEILLGLMGGYDELSSGSEDEEEEEQEGGEAPELVDASAAKPDSESKAPFDLQNPNDVNSKDYLASDLKFTDTAILDSDDNGVMMEWETQIMDLSAHLLAPEEIPNPRVLNIGFGMGIVDRFFAAKEPATHHIIEAHPGVLATLKNLYHDFGPNWETAKEEGRNKVWAGRWQDIVPALLEAGEMYDAIYFDTFGEDYGALKTFFQDYVPGLLSPEGRFGFFNGLGADRRVCYDVYTRVVEMDCSDAGLDVQWVDVEVPLEELGASKEETEGEGKGDWKGVRRRYWTLDTYRLPICTFMQ